MAQWNQFISVTFNDNDGKVGWQTNPTSAEDLIRHHKIFGVWRTRWILFKAFWRALRWAENYSQNCEGPKPRRWVFRAEIPE